MEPEQNFVVKTVEQKTKFFAPLFQVTKLSKYFAILLFVMMPFIGGWVGYWYAFDRHILTNSLTTSNLQYSKQTDLQDSTTYDFNHYSYVPEYRRGESLIDIENLLAKAPFTWNEKEYRTNYSN